MKRAKRPTKRQPAGGVGITIQPVRRSAAVQKHLELLVSFGMYGRDVDEVVDRIICDWLQQNARRINDLRYDIVRDPVTLEVR
jgi:hypothetical protein